jgi:DNA-directed RNA polymerase specialized sigma24 family protein
LLRKANYSSEEVEAVAEGYEELLEARYKPWVHIRLIDFRRAFAQLKPERQQAVLLCGLLGYSTRQAAPILQVSHTTVANRYKAGLDAIKSYLNGVRH